MARSNSSHSQHLGRRTVGLLLLLPHGRSGPGHRCWKLLALLPGVGPGFLTLLFLQPSARLGASLLCPWGWGSVLTVPQLCEPSSPAALALCASSISPLRFPWRVLTQVLLCRVFLTDHMPDLCPALVLPNHSQRRPACRRDSAACGSHRCPLEQQVLGGRIRVGQSLMRIHWQSPGEGGLQGSASQIAAMCGFSSCRGLFFFTRGFISPFATLQGELQIYYCPL